MEIRGLEIKSQYKGQTRYEGAVLTVSAYGKWNDNQVAFKEIDGFWLLPESYHLQGTKDKRPPIGSTSKYHLKTKPQVTNPEKFYMDIEGIEKADGEPIAQQSAPPQGDPRDEYVAPQQQSKDNYWDAKDARIAKAQAWNGTLALYRTYLAADQKTRDLMIIHAEEYGDSMESVHKDVWFGRAALKAGKTPFTVEETEWDEPPIPADEINGMVDDSIRELDQQAQQHLSEQQPEFQTTPEFNAAQGAAENETVERLPWD